MSGDTPAPDAGSVRLLESLRGLAERSLDTAAVRLAEYEAKHGPIEPMSSGYRHSRKWGVEKQMAYCKRKLIDAGRWPRE